MFGLMSSGRRRAVWAFGIGVALVAVPLVGVGAQGAKLTPFAEVFLKRFLARDHVADSLSPFDPKVRTLQGLPGFEILVESLPAEVELAGLTKAKIQTDVELRLRQAGIRVLTIDEQSSITGQPLLYVNINAIPDGELLTFSLHLAAKQDVYLASTGMKAHGVDTWATGSVGRARVEKIRQTVRDHVDEFLNDYLKANPRAPVPMQNEEPEDIPLLLPPKKDRT